jgi:C-terminal processing protease CtpA/Prc
LRAGDTIIGINGTPIRTEADYDKAVDASGQDMDLAIVRPDGAQHVITVRLRY